MIDSTRIKAATRLAAILFVPALPGTWTHPAYAASDWTGKIRCEILSRGDGYEHLETQTWTLTGAPPAAQGSYTVHEANWAVTAQGWHDFDPGYGTRRIASWTAKTSAQSAPIAIMVSTNQLLVQKWHSQLTVQAGYTGPDMYINNGVATRGKDLAMTVYEWQFQGITGAPAATQLTGSGTVSTVPSVAPLPPSSGAQASVTCTWALGRGSAPALPPPTLPPPTPPPALLGGALPTLPPDPATLPTLGPGRPGGTVQSPGGGGPTLSPTATPAGPPQDPVNFTATLTGPGQVELRWDAVPGVATYSVVGPGLPQGRLVSATSTIVTGLPDGLHEWLVTSWYVPDGSLTNAENWPRTSLTITPQAGRYRVTATRIKVHQEEPDKRYKEHGRNNEIFLTEHSQVIDRKSGTQLAYDGVVSHPGVKSMIHSTPIHGDTHNANAGAFQYRIQAGSFAASGGIQTGDQFPVWDADQMQHRSQASDGSSAGVGIASHPSPGVLLSTEYQPFVLWEGDLNAGAEVVLLRPVLWLAINTWNTSSTDQFLGPYVARVAGTESSRDFLSLPSINDAIGKPSVAPVKVPELRTSGQWLVDRHRPFGLEVSGSDNGAQASMTDIAVVLTQEKVEAFLAGRSSGELEVRIRGATRNRNAAPMGDASLYLKIERLR
jgi:hypothetical protein